MSVRIIPFDYQEIGREIRARRNKLGMTQRQLAAKIPCSLTYISRIENGAKPSLEVLVRIAHILDMSLDSIFCVQAEDDTEFTRVLRSPPPIPRSSSDRVEHAVCVSSFSGIIRKYL